MTAPTFAPFPDSALHPHLTQEHWNDLVITWAAATTKQSELLQGNPSVDVSDDLVAFLETWMEARASGMADSQLKPTVVLRLSKSIYELTCKLLRHNPPSQLVSWEFLADFSAVYAFSSATNAEVAMMLDTILGPKGSDEAAKSLAELKKKFIQSLHAAPKCDLNGLAATIARVRPLVESSPAVASHLSSGDDFLDGLISAYRTMHPLLRIAITSLAYLCIIGLIKGPAPNPIILRDKLFALKAAADAHRDGPLRSEDSLVPELVSVTPLISKIRRFRLNNTSASIQNTITSRLDALEEYRRPGAEAEARRRAGKAKGSSKVAKGKGRALDVDLGRAMSDVRMATISRVQEVFPDLGPGFIARLLDEYGDDTDRAMSAMYDYLPGHLENSDRTESLESYLAPMYFESQLPVRKNTFDGDELDNLAFKTMKLSFGKSTNEKNADDVLNDRSSAPSKDKIKSALKSFDPDDDERDDTYDADDVGGAVPTADNPDDDEDDPLDEVLFQAYLKNPEVFDRTPEARQSAERASLRGSSGQTDEDMEGWALMLAQNPRRQRLLKQLYGIERISQKEIQRTSYRASKGEAREEEGSDMSSSRGAFRGNRGRGRGRGGGNVPGSSGDKDTENARRRKEAHKGSRANHNRRDGHAKKMARGGFAP